MFYKCPTACLSASLPTAQLPDCVHAASPFDALMEGAFGAAVSTATACCTCAWEHMNAHEMHGRHGTYGFGDEVHSIRGLFLLSVVHQSEIDNLSQGSLGTLKRSPTPIHNSARQANFGPLTTHNPTYKISPHIPAVDVAYPTSSWHVAPAAPLSCPPLPPRSRLQLLNLNSNWGCDS